MLVFLPFSLGAEKADKRATFATNIKSIAESDDREASILEKISSYSLGWINGELDKTEEKIKSNTNFTHFGINIGVDTLGLKSEYSPYMELMSVYRLLEKSNVFLFNQTSLSNFEGPFTLRTWLHSASNFVKTRCRRFHTFDFPTSKAFFEIFWS